MADEEAKTTLLTFFNLAAFKILRNPETFTSLDAIGFLIDLGTDPNAAWCDIMSILLQAFIQKS